MKKYIGLLGLTFAFLLAASPSESADFDGSRPLLVSVTRAIECVPDGSCQQVSPASIDLPQFLKVDFSQKTIRPVTGDQETPDTFIERQEVVDGKLILQGAEDGYAKMQDGVGWTLSISEQNGQVVLTASGEQVAFVVFGTALPYSWIHP